jgi:hypothetical protein
VWQAISRTNKLSDKNSLNGMQSQNLQNTEEENLSPSQLMMTVNDLKKKSLDFSGTISRRVAGRRVACLPAPPHLPSPLIAPHTAIDPASVCNKK